MTSSKVTSGFETSSLASYRNSRAVRWYVLTLPVCHRGAARGLAEEQSRRRRCGESPLDYFAPTYVEVKKRDGAWIRTDRPLLFNYVFVRASETEIYRMMRSGALSLYSFLPRVRDDHEEHYPYLTDDMMRNLQWIARSYADEVPLYTPEPERLMKGDRVRITEGQFAGAEATVLIQPGVGERDVVVCLEGCLYIPLFHVRAGQYEIVELHNEGSHLYTRLNNDRLFQSLHAALERYHQGRLTADDRALATEVEQQYGRLRMTSDVTRSKLYALLLPAYTILGDSESRNRMIGQMRELAERVTAEQSRALLWVTLYGCTDSSIYYDHSHAIVDGWRNDPKPKKSKLQLLQRLADYDRWLGHLPQ